MTPQIKKILYATDLTRNSAYVFQYALELAQEHGATIVILHVVEPIPPMVRHLFIILLPEGESHFTFEEI
jgi:nucleotide-binding universal stress UspA family protein